MLRRCCCLLLLLRHHLNLPPSKRTACLEPPTAFGASIRTLAQRPRRHLTTEYQLTLLHLIIIIISYRRPHLHLPIHHHPLLLLHVLLQEKRHLPINWGRSLIPSRRQLLQKGCQHHHRYYYYYHLHRNHHPPLPPSPTHTIQCSSEAVVATVPLNCHRSIQSRLITITR